MIMPQCEMPQLEMPQLEMPQLEMPQLEMPQAVATAKDNGVKQVLGILQIQARINNFTKFNNK